MAESRITIVGRVNVGKSTLFNRLTKTRDAIVENTPGVTRDRKEGRFNLAGHPVTLVDTGGIDSEAIDGKPADIAQQHSQIAIEDSDLLLFMVDARVGLLPGDHEIAQLIRKSNKPTILIVNKVDPSYKSQDLHEFYKLGLGEPLCISAEHNENIDVLVKTIAENLEIKETDPDLDIAEEEETCIAIIGRPNVGKSSFINVVLGKDRHIVTDVPGTTRDSVDSLVTYHGKTYRFIDTAGLKRIGKTKGKLEKVTAIMTRRSIERCHIALLLFDSYEGVTAQDLKIASYIVEEGKAVIIIGNKWDLTARTTEEFKELQQSVRDKFVSMSWAPFMVMSALEEHNIQKVLGKIDVVMSNSQMTIPTPRLNKLLHDVQIIHPPPRRDARNSTKFYYGTQISNRPPTFLLFTNTRTEIHFSYRRFLANQIRAVYPFEGWPLRMIFRHRHDERGKRWD